MAEGEPRKVLIPKGTLDPDQNNVIEIPVECEDSRVLIAKLQAKFSKPPRYYPPLTNPENKFERRIGDYVCGLGLPPLSPMKEEPRNYSDSLSQYGPPKEPEYVSYEPSYFGTDTTHGSRSISGKFDYCPSSTPKATRNLEEIDFPSPNLSPIRLYRDIFAPDPSVYREDYTPHGSPPRMPSPPPRSPLRDISIPVPQPRAPSPRRSPPRRRPAPVSDDGSCSLGDLSDMLSWEASRGAKESLNYTPESVRALSHAHHHLLQTPGTPDPCLTNISMAMPEEINHSIINSSMCELECLELEELQTIQIRMRNFQEARKELVFSILNLPEAEF